MNLNYNKNFLSIIKTINLCFDFFFINFKKKKYKLIFYIILPIKSVKALEKIFH